MGRAWRRSWERSVRLSRAGGRRSPPRGWRFREEWWFPLGGEVSGLGRLAAVPTRRTKRGPERTPLSGDFDVLICGASFAGLAVAREFAGSGARVMMVDRYEIGERQTSACAAPTGWLRALGLDDSIRQTFDELVV